MHRRIAEVARCEIDVSERYLLEFYGEERALREITPNQSYIIHDHVGKLPVTEKTVLDLDILPFRLGKLDADRFTSDEFDTMQSTFRHV